MTTPRTETPSPLTAPRTQPVAQAPNSSSKSRLGATWVALAAFTVVLILLIVFILENSTQTPIDYFGSTGHLQVGILVLLSAIAGIVLTLLLGSLRIVQLKLQQRGSR